MEVRLDVRTVTPFEAVDGMREPFLGAFGRGWVGRRLGGAAWAAFCAALLHGSGLPAAAAQAQLAAECRNVRTLLAARWTTRRIQVVVARAVQVAAHAA